jgi:hypothetical protein
MLRGLFIGSITMGGAALLLASCGEVDETAPSGSGGASSTSASSSSSGGAGGMGGAGGGGSFCADAGAIYYNEQIMGDLATTGQQDFYRFPGKKGDVVAIDIDAQYFGEDTEYDPTYIDSVVTLFNEDGVQVAQNDDPFEYSTNDSRLYTILPADGEYCVRVEECWTTLAGSGIACQGVKDKLFTSYALYLNQFVDEPGDAVTVEVEAGDDATSATPIAYEKSFSGIYETTFWGTFKDKDDVDVWSFTLPTDLDPAPPAGVRTIGRFFIMPSGPSGSGSTVPTGRVWVADAAAPDVVLAEINADINTGLMPRLELGTPYLIFVTRTKNDPATYANDFYFIRHRPGWGYPLELEVGIGMNNTPAMAEELTLSEGEDGVFIGGVEGDLGMAAQDVDHFMVTVPDGMKFATATADCRAQREGSGLRKLTPSFFKLDGSPFPNNDSGPEIAKEDAFASIPEPDSKVILKIQAESQDPVVTQAFYQCVIFFEP